MMKINSESENELEQHINHSESGENGVLKERFHLSFPTAKRVKENSESENELD